MENDVVYLYPLLICWYPTNWKFASNGTFEINENDKVLKLIKLIST